MISESSPSDSRLTNNNNSSSSSSSSRFDSQRFKRLMEGRRANSLPDDPCHISNDASKDSLVDDEDRTNQILSKKRSKFQVLRQQTSDLGPLPQHQQEVFRWEKEHVDLHASPKLIARDIIEQQQQQKTTSTKISSFNLKRVQQLKASLLSNHYFNQDAIDPHIYSKTKRLQKFPSLRKQGSPQALAALAELAATQQEITQRQPPPIQLLPLRRRLFNAATAPVVADDGYSTTTTGVPSNKEIIAARNRFPRLCDVDNLSIDPSSRTSDVNTRSKTRNFLPASLSFLLLVVTVVGLVYNWSSGHSWSFINFWFESRVKSWVSLQDYFNFYTTWILNGTIFKEIGIIEDSIVLQGGDRHRDFLSYNLYARSIGLHPTGLSAEKKWFQLFWLGDSITHSDNELFYSKLDFVYCDDDIYFVPSVKLINRSNTGSSITRTKLMKTAATDFATSSTMLKQILHNNATNIYNLYNFQTESKPDKVGNTSIISSVSQHTSIADHVANDNMSSVSICRPWMNSTNLLYPDYFLPRDTGSVLVKNEKRTKTSRMKYNNHTCINGPGLNRRAISNEVQRWGPLDSITDYHPDNLSWASLQAPDKWIMRNNSKNGRPMPSIDIVQLTNFTRANDIVISASFKNLNLSALLYDDEIMQQAVATEERHQSIYQALEKIQIAQHLDKFGEILKGASLTVWVSTL